MSNLRALVFILETHMNKGADGEEWGGVKEGEGDEDELNGWKVIWERERRGMIFRW